MAVRKRIALALAAVFLSLLLVWFWMQPSRTQELPDPNGYEEFSEAARSLRGHSAYADLGHHRAVSFIEQNRAVLDQVRRGLGQESRVPVQNSQEWLTGRGKELARIKQLVHAIITEGKVAETAGHHERALQIYLDALEFSYRVIQGGLTYDYLYGLSYKAMVFRAIGDLAPQLNAEQSRRALRRLDELEAGQESLKSFALRERAWCRKTLGADILDHLQAIVRSRSLYPELATLQRQLAAFDQAKAAVREKLIASAEGHTPPR